MPRKLTPANIIIIAGALLAFVGSFLSFEKITFGGLSRSVGSSWSDHFFIMATLPALLVLAMGVLAALESFAQNVAIPSRVLGFTLDQVHVILGFQATIMMLAWAIVDFFGLSKGIGLYLMLFGAIACLVGAIVRVVQAAPQRPPAI
jgi:hypothetical protein